MKALRSFASRFRKSVFLLEAGAAIILYGSLIHQAELAREGLAALHELSALGYSTPTADEPVRAYPATTSGSFDGSHAAGWRPGVISLRESPVGSLGPEIYLRHELMHEASFRTCSGKLPLWAEEAAAMSFSGELRARSWAEQASSGELERLKKRIRIGAALDAESYQALSHLAALYGWPKDPCRVSEKMEKLLSIPAPAAEVGFSYILISLASGRVFEAKGDMESAYAPGSLLKIPYAAALGKGASDEIGAELASSDTERLLKRRDSFELDVYRLLVSTVKNASLGQSLSAEELGGKDERFWRRYLGERDKDGGFPLEASLREIAMVLRASLLFRPNHFSGLAGNGFVEGSTLFHEPEESKRVLGKLHAMSKTGTVSDERGNPLVGHLMVAWPVEDPAFLAVLRSRGSNGASNLRRASKLLEEWSSRYPVDFKKVRIRVLGSVPRSSWEILDECPGFTIEPGRGWSERVSVCGRFRILSSAKGSRPERLVTGVLQTYAEDQKAVLVTDPESYADAVLFAEAQSLQGEARKALRAVIVWNGVHGKGRHEDSSSLCDLTHCMVFQGEPPGSELKKRLPEHTDPDLLKTLDELAAGVGLSWLPFSKGGDEKWQKIIPSAVLSKMVKEEAPVDLLRERSRSGEVVIHLFYPEGEEVVPCEVFRNALKLPSCPETVRRDENRGGWLFEGVGEGHGRGMSFERAGALAASGYSAAAILKDAYR